MWGKVYEASRTFAIEFYIGAGIDLTFATRTDYSRYATYEPYTYKIPHEIYVSKLLDNNIRRNQPIPDFIDKSFYARPSIQVGIKLRLRM